MFTNYLLSFTRIPVNACFNYERITRLERYRGISILKMYVYL